MGRRGGEQLLIGNLQLASLLDSPRSKRKASNANRSGTSPPLNKKETWRGRRRVDVADERMQHKSCTMIASNLATLFIQ